MAHEQKPVMYFVKYRFGTDQPFGQYVCTEKELPQIFMDCVKRSDIVRFVVKKQHEQTD